jgi:hypothetical protein
MSPRRRSEERGVVTPNVALPDSGIHAPGRSVLVEAVLPNFDGRSSLSLRAPFEDFSPRASASPKEGLLSWAFPQRWTSPALWPLYRVSKNSKAFLSLPSTSFPIFHFSWYLRPSVLQLLLVYIYFTLFPFLLHFHPCGLL